MTVHPASESPDFHTVGWRRFFLLAGMLNLAQCAYHFATAAAAPATPELQLAGRSWPWLQWPSPSRVAPPVVNVAFDSTSELLGFTPSIPAALLDALGLHHAAARLPTCVGGALDGLVWLAVGVAGLLNVWHGLINQRTGPRTVALFGLLKYQVAASCLLIVCRGTAGAASLPILLIESAQGTAFFYYAAELRAKAKAAAPDLLERLRQAVKLLEQATAHMADAASVRPLIARSRALAVSTPELTAAAKLTAAAEAADQALATQEALELLQVAGMVSAAAVTDAVREAAEAEAAAAAAAVECPPAEPPPGCTIDDTAKRGITLEQLRGVADEIMRRCIAEGWNGEFELPDGTRETRTLTPSTTNLYHLAANFIKPMTASRRCSYVEIVAHTAQIPTWFVSHWWGEPVLKFLACIERHAADHDLPADTPYWVCAYANNQHKLEKDVTTNPVESSFARAIELAEGRVLSVLDDAGMVFTRVWCCFELVLCRELALPPADSSTTITEGSMLEGSLSSTGDVAEIAVQRFTSEPSHMHRRHPAAVSTAASSSAVGASSANPPQVKRESSWRTGVIKAQNERGKAQNKSRRLGLGTYEMYTAKPRCEAYDHLKVDEVLEQKRRQSKAGEFAWRDVWRHVFTALPVVTDRDAVGLTDGPTGNSTGSGGGGVDCGLATLQNRRQQCFPLDLIMRAFRIRVQDAQTTEPKDRIHILNYMVGRRGDDLELEPEKAHKSYDDINAWLHGCFASHAFRRLLEWGDMDMRKISERVRKSGLETLRLSFRGCEAFTDDVAELLVDSLSTSLEEIQLEMAESRATGGRQVLDALEHKVDLHKLTEVMLGECLLTGPVPSWFGECVSLEKLVLQRNALMGPIPPELGKCVQLQHLAISNNQLSGPVPEELLANCRQLRNLFINNNQLTGSLPTAIGQCTQLCELNMCANQLTGTIPEELGQCTALTKILLNRNKLNGAIPASLGRCLELRELYLSSNQLSGAIPAELGQCVGLATLSLGDNRLACCPEGRNSKLPAALGNCLALTELKVDADIVPNNERDLPQPLQLRRSEGSFELHAITSPSKSPQVRPV